MGDKIKIIDRIEESILKIGALVGAHALAFYFDAELVYMVFGADLLLLGIVVINGTVKKAS